MNFDKDVRDTCIFNQRVQINYTTGYISFSDPHRQSNNKQISDFRWQNQYLLANLINCTTFNELYANDFLLLFVDLWYREDTVWYTISKVSKYYFAKVICTKKIKIDYKLFIPLSLIYVC